MDLSAISQVPAESSGIDLSSIPKIGDSNIDLNAIPAVKTYHPAEVAVDSNNPDLRAFAHAVGIDYDTAAKSDLFDKQGMIQQYKDKNPGIANNVSRSLGAAAPVASDSITNFTEGALHTLGSWADAATHKAQDWADTPENSASDNAARKLQEAVNANINERLVNKGANISATGSYDKPIATTVGNVAGTVVPAMVGGEAIAGALPEVTAAGPLGFGLRTAKSVTVGAGSGAAAEPGNMVEGAKSGAEWGGGLHLLGEAAGASVNAINKTGTALGEVNDTANTLGAKVGLGDVTGRDITGERTISAALNTFAQNHPVMNWLVGGKTLDFLSGSTNSQIAKQLSTQKAVANAIDLTDSKWVNTLANEPNFKGPAIDNSFNDLRANVEASKTKIQSLVGKGDAESLTNAQTEYKTAQQHVYNWMQDHPNGVEPAHPNIDLDAVKANYNNLSPDGQRALIAGYMERSLAKNTKGAPVDMSTPETYQNAKDSVQFQNSKNAAFLPKGAGSGAVTDLGGVSKDLHDLLDVTGNKQMSITGENRWSLKGLQNLVDTVNNPAVPGKVTESLARTTNQGVQTAKGLTAAALRDGASDALEGVLGLHTTAHVGFLSQGAAIGANIYRRALNNPAIRNGLIDLSAAANDAQRASAYARINKAAQAANAASNEQ